MRFSISGEIDGSVGDRFLSIANRFASEMEQGLDAPILRELNFEVCYMPIVMNGEDLHRYPARTKASSKERVFYACPQLDFAAFAEGNEAEACHEYGRGLRDELPKLSMLSATPDQIAELSRLVDRAEANMISEQS